MGIPTKEWGDIPSHRLVFCQTSPQAVFKMEANAEESQEAFSQKSRTYNIVRVEDTILAAAAEVGID